MQEASYGNTKNFSQLNNNYSYRNQLQRQIIKAKKHQPNKALSKLIDLGEFEAHKKINKDNLIKNIANKFADARTRLRGQKLTGYSTPRTPAPLEPTQGLTPHDLRRLHEHNKSQSPSVRQSLTRYDSPGPLTALEMAELRSQYSTETDIKDYIMQTPRTLNKINLHKHPNSQDPTSISPINNPFLMSENNKATSNKSSVAFKMPKGIDKAPIHYMTTFQELSRAKNNTEHLLPAVQSKNLSIERAANSIRNKTNCVKAMQN